MRVNTDYSIRENSLLFGKLSFLDGLAGEIPGLKS